jgi:hypothetical protein
MFISRRVDTASIFDIEVSTFFSCSLHELSGIGIDDIIHSTAEAVTALAHGLG